MRFAPNGIIDLLDAHPVNNLGESTAVDLVAGELLDTATMARLGMAVLGYGSSLGNPELRQFIASDLGVTDAEVLVTPGGSAAFTCLVFGLCERDDHVVVTTPNFPPTLNILSAMGIATTLIRLRFDSAYRLDVDEVIEALQPNTTAVHLTTPINPSGTAHDPVELCRLADQLSQRCPDAVLVIDESYRQATYADNPPAESLAGSRPNIVVTGSLSKCHGAPGLRIGWIATTKANLLAAIATAKMNLFISCSIVDEFLAIEVLRRSDQLLAHRRQLLSDGYNIVRDWVTTNTERITWVPPTAGALCCIRLRPHLDPHRFRQALLSVDAMLGDGRWFDEQPDVFRLGFGYLPVEQLPAALEAINTALDHASRS